MLKDLPIGLAEKLGKIGNTPFEEPELFGVIEKIKTGAASFIDIINPLLTDEEMDEYTVPQLKQFGEAVEFKITSLQDENGFYKYSENLSEWQPPKPSQAKRVHMLQKANVDKKKKLLKGIDIEKIDIMNIPEKILKAVTKMAEEMETFMIEISGITNADELTPWEKDLLLAMTSDAVNGYDNSFLGKK